MARHLSDEWLASLAELAGTDTGRPELDGCIQVTVSGTPYGKVPWHLVVDKGVVAEVAGGNLDDPGLVITETWADSVARWQGARSRPVEYMQGDLKVKGSTGELLAFLGMLESAAWTSAVADLLAETDWSE
ncbi:MAG: hypothetical protein GY745_22530 [Actinomycetia bacterium]|nr:hypothetical protein [Actinomycetes bacterium]MCP3910786.1 hypothetical protein [Actinomycetes bacterium]MCP4087795.1 hypothetical protein [Actinomycetes bacterium]